MTYSLVTYLSASSTTVGLSSVCFTNFWLSYFTVLNKDQTHIDQTKHCHWNFCRVSLDQVLLQLFQTNIKRLFGRSQPAISRFAAGSNNSSSRVIAGYNPSSRVITGYNPSIRVIASYNSRSRLISYSKRKLLPSPECLGHGGGDKFHTELTVETFSCEHKDSININGTDYFNGTYNPFATVFFASGSRILCAF